jgi:hypothetical protein
MVACTISLPPRFCSACRPYHVTKGLVGRRGAARRALCCGLAARARAPVAVQRDARARSSARPSSARATL